jgi:hypothetical protein
MPNVQLILFPQGSNSFTFTTSINQFCGNSRFTSPLDLSAQYTGATPYNTITGAVGQVLFPNAQPIIGNWRGFSTDGTTSFRPATNAPVVVNGNLNLTSAASTFTSISGVYQLIDNLTVGANYEVFIKYSPLSITGGVILLTNGHLHTNGSRSIGSTFQSTTVQNLTFNFNATHSEQVLVVKYSSSTGETLVIEEITIKETTPASITDLEDGSVICDLYEEEAIPLSLSVDNFINAAEKVQSYSKDFNLPATKRNNKIFNSIFEVQKSIENTLDFNL